MKKLSARTSRLLAAVMLWTSVCSGYYFAQAAESGPTGAETAAETAASGQTLETAGNEPAVELAASAIAGKDQGLLGEYYAGTETFDFGEHKATVIDTQINFSNLEEPLQTWTGRSDDANVRWTGRITPPETGEYTFYMIGDNGFRLWIDGQLVIDHWVNDWDVEQTSAPVALEGGKKYDFKVEYFEDYGGSNLYLRWSTPTLAKEIVPASAFTLPASYNGPVAASAAPDGLSVAMTTYADLGTLPDGLKDHLAVTANGSPIALESVEPGSAPSELKLHLETAVRTGQLLNVTYDGQAGLLQADGTPVAAFRFSPVNLSNETEPVDYSPIAIAMSFNGSPKTNRAFAWYTRYDRPDRAPANIMDSIVEIVPADAEFGSPQTKRFVGKPEETQALTLRITGSATGSFISHKVLAEGLTPGTAYKYRVGSDGNWSETGTFTTEADGETSYDFLYLTDSQGSNTHDYEVWAETLGNAVADYPDAKFLLMTGDQVDAGALESQWLDYFGKPQHLLMDLPLMALIGNHEGPYNSNFSYHFNYPTGAIDDELPEGTVYSFDYGDAHFMVLNTMDIGWDDRQKESFRQQIEWLKREVAETDKKWKVVAIHKAIYSLGGHSLDADILELRKTLYPIFDELGIDVVLQGHDHTYMRSHQMYGDKAVESVDTDENGNALNPDGTLYMINNASGTKFYDLKNGVDRYYAAVYEQPYKAIYSGIRMTEDSFTIESYRSGEEQPFDTYTIVRTDGRPEPVQGLSVSETEDGKPELSWTKPADSAENDAVRGFRIYETSGRLGANWSAFVPAAEGAADYRFTIEGTNEVTTYRFAVTAVDERDNSAPATVEWTGSGIAAPTAPVVDDGRNTFGWTNVPGYADLSDYEFSTDGGATWSPVTANPQPIGDGLYAAGDVRVRVAASEAEGRPAGASLASDKPYTLNGARDVYQIKGELARGERLKLDATVEKLEEYDGEAYAVFQLLKGDTPQLINAVPIPRDELSVTQYFDVSGTEYSVKVFVLNRFDNDPSVPDQLARAQVYR